MRAVYEGLYFLDAKCVFVTERTVLRGALDGLKLLVLPEASHVPDDVAGRILDWARGGTTVLAVGPCLTHDDLNRRRAAEPPAGTTAPIAEVQATEGALGKGRIIRLDPPSDLGAYRALGDELLARVGAKRPVRVVNEKGGQVDGVEMRSAANDGERLYYLINMNKSAVVVDLTPRPRAAQDLITGKEIGFPCEMACLEVLLLQGNGS